MATLEARSVVGLEGADKMGRRAETGGETGAETTGGGADEEDPLLESSDGARMFRITAVKNRSRDRFYLRFAWGLEPFWFQSVHLNDSFVPEIV